MGKPSSCPRCGSSSVYKERINGFSTGDWVCSDCGKEGQMNEEPMVQGEQQKQTQDKD